MKTTFCSLYDQNYTGTMTAFMRQLGYHQVEPKDFENADIIVFNGGADIGSSIYGEKPIDYRSPFEPSKRDQTEIDIFKLSPSQLKVGICRGAQLLNCLNGGTLWQDVNQHHHDHMMTILASNEQMVTTSTHHQMMRPNLKTAKILATANLSTLKVSSLDKFQNQIPEDDIEIVYYPDTYSLCIQGHPEYVPNSKFAKYCSDLIAYYLKEISLSAVS
jgi:gamma-glutamyl-gamma-aminobutyrate hydrolase PuuD